MRHCTSRDCMQLAAASFLQYIWYWRVEIFRRGAGGTLEVLMNCRAHAVQALTIALHCECGRAQLLIL